VLAGVQMAQEVGFNSIKINVVLQKNTNDHEINDFIAWTKHNAINVRFIELMQTGNNLSYFKQHHLSPKIIQQQLLENGWKQNDQKVMSGPAVNYSHPDYKGKVGLIMPYDKSFCTKCNRLRISSHGGLHLCLFTDISYSLRPMLQSPQQKELLKQHVCKLITLKKQAHVLGQGKTGITNNLAVIGG
jgi:cyclic pyranopterin phosphate synthase